MKWQELDYKNNKNEIKTMPHSVWATWVPRLASSAQESRPLPHFPRRISSLNFLRRSDYWRCLDPPDSHSRHLQYRASMAEREEIEPKEYLATTFANVANCLLQKHAVMLDKWHRQERSDRVLLSRGSCEGALGGRSRSQGFLVESQVARCTDLLLGFVGVAWRFFAHPGF